MRLISRSVVREITPPFLLGFAGYTFILLVRTVFLMTDFFVRRSATFSEVSWLVLLSIPWMIVLTIPMAFLLGVLIGIGRLSGDSELVALRACGVGPGALYRPALGLAVVLSVGVFLFYNFVLPRANEELTRSMLASAHSIRSLPSGASDRSRTSWPIVIVALIAPPPRPPRLPPPRRAPRHGPAAPREIRDGRSARTPRSPCRSACAGRAPR